ncbi:hypothetical protein FZEAL_7294 [Fusarium zealandicum]|uniref:Uncharacterized protein n=1 Tax=Fusarium zealandicum TaxID=1053134 RepID=A0A8H4XIL6_9HYPO|nr:hypothetical protein FZEAL_7294 [Fusarium zealandicum]
MRATHERALCEGLPGRLRKIGSAYFDFVVDRRVWGESFSIVNPADKPEWPWKESKPSAVDMRDGASMIFANWIQEKETAVVAEMDPELKGDMEIAKRTLCDMDVSSTQDREDDGKGHED